MSAAWKDRLGSALVGVFSALVAAALHYSPVAWQWWAIFAGCYASGVARAELTR